MSWIAIGILPAARAAAELAGTAAVGPGACRRFANALATVEAAGTAVDFARTGEVRVEAINASAVAFATISFCFSASLARIGTRSSGIVVLS